MAVRKIKTRAGTVRWQACTPDRRQVARNFDTQRAAKAWAAEQEGERAAAAVPQRYRALIILMAAAGLRPSEATGLTRTASTSLPAGP